MHLHSAYTPFTIQLYNLILRAIVTGVEVPEMGSET